MIRHTKSALFLFAAGIATALFATPVQAQYVQWSGPSTPGHVASEAYNGILQDGGTSTAGRINSLGLYGLGGTPFCLTNSPTPGPFGGSYSQICLGESTTAATLSLNSYGGAAHIPLNIAINGSTVFSAGDSSATLPGFTLPFTSITGNIATSQMASGAGASSATFWRGDGTRAAFAPSGGIAGPSTVTAGYVPTWSGTSGTVLANGYAVGQTGNNVLLETGSTGAISSSVIPPPGGSTLGGIKTADCSGSNEFVQTINTSGTATCALPSAFGNINVNAGATANGGVAISGSGVGVGVQINNTSSGGHNWFLDSNSSAVFAIVDATDSVLTVAGFSDSGTTLYNGLTVYGAITASSSIQAQGYATRTGISGGVGGNNFNINWAGGSAYLWIDNNNIGAFNITASDRRLKKRITPLTGGLSRIMALRPVEFSWKDTNDIFKDDGKRHHSFIADELQKVIPTAVNGAPNAADSEGKPAYQSLNPSEILPDMVQAIQDLKRQLAVDEAEIALLRKNR